MVDLHFNDLEKVGVIYSGGSTLMIWRKWG